MITRRTKVVLLALLVIAIWILMTAFESQLSSIPFVYKIAASVVLAYWLSSPITKWLSK
jgi:hypothetical protein